MRLFFFDMMILIYNFEADKLQLLLFKPLKILDIILFFAKHQESFSL